MSGVAMRMMRGEESDLQELVEDVCHADAPRRARMR